VLCFCVLRTIDSELLFTVFQAINDTRFHRGSNLSTRTLFVSLKEKFDELGTLTEKEMWNVVVPDILLPGGFGGNPKTMANLDKFFKSPRAALAFEGKDRVWALDALDKAKAKSLNPHQDTQANQGTSGGPLLSPSPWAAGAPLAGADQISPSMHTLATPSSSTAAAPSDPTDPTDDELFQAVRDYLRTQDLVTVMTR
jgi:hypothetical protein